MKSLILIALLAFISCDITVTVPPIISTTYKCPDEKLKLKDDLCAIYVDDTDSTSSKSTDVLYIKKKCGKNKHCIEYVSSSYKYYDSNKYEDIVYYTCIKTKLSLLKVNKKCSLNSECLTGICKGNKCSTLDPCYSSEHCGKGKYCDKSGSTNTCKAYVNEGGTCSRNDFCSNGLYCYYGSSTTGKCQKYFSLDVGTKNVDHSELCKTGIISNDGNYMCVTFSSYDSDKDKLLCKDGDGKEVECIVSGPSGNTFIDKSSNKVPIYSKGKFDLLGDIIKRYNKIKLDKLNDKEEGYDYYNYYGDKKYAELKAVYDNYAYLLNQGLIKENGKKNGDNKCEYEFWKSTISSSYINVCLGFALALLSLLF